MSAIIETSSKGKATFEKIILLRSRYEQQIMGLGRRAKIAHLLLLELFSSPATNAAKAAKHLNISISAANNLVNELASVNILKELTGFSRNRIFILHDYIDLFNG